MTISPADPVVPFGKYAGKNASDIPVDYLDWLIDQSWVNEQLKIDVESHLNGPRRAEWQRISQEDD